MNIKISIKDCDCQPTVFNNRELSEVEHKKKTMLYAPPERDTRTATAKGMMKKKQQPTRTVQKGRASMNSKEYRESEQQMLNELKKSERNHATIDMVQNSNMILQRQAEILEQNQKVIHEMNGKEKMESKESEAVRNQLREAMNQIQRQVEEIRKMRNDIVSAAQEFNKNVAEMRGGNLKNANDVPQKMTNMNNDLQNMVAVSKNHLEGLENLEAIKSLQNFNIEGYNQAINTIKRQIAQYQKQSENIERELKIRSAKLQKLNISPSFEEELYKPYQQHIANRVKNIDLHAIRDRVAEKLGSFDYGKFEYDVGNIMNEAKSELGNFAIICKEYKITVPDIKFDPKQTKKMNVKTTSVLDQYKALRGITFEQKKENIEKISNKNSNSPQRLKKTNQIQERLKQGPASMTTKRPQSLKIGPSKPMDRATEVRLVRQYEKKTILQNENKAEKKQLEERMKKNSKQKKKEDDEFEKYLENRAKEELELIYKERKEKLERMQKELYEQCTNPTFIDLNLTKEEVRGKKRQSQKNQTGDRQREGDQYNEEFEEQSDNEEKNKSRQKQRKKEEIQNQQQRNLKEVGREVLKEKIKQLMSKKQQTNSVRVEPAQPFQNQSDDSAQIQNMAVGFINMINNTLTQVNSNLANTIQRKIQSSQERRPASLQRKQSKRIQIPKLEPFRPPPVFNMNLVQSPMMPEFSQRPIEEKKKIVVEDYEKYVPKGIEQYNEFNISSDESDDV